MFRAITPRFIKQIDGYLLTHHPVLWTSKIHFALWHGFILWLLSAAVGMLMPVNLQGRIEYELWYSLFTVIGLVILCFWVYHYQIFNKEKSYGYKFPGDEYKNFFLVFAVVAVFLTTAWPFEIIYNYRIANLYSDEEVIEDLNSLNVNHPYTAGTPQIYFAWNDSVSSQQYITLKKLSPHGSGFFTPHYIRQDSVKFPSLLTDYQLYKLYSPDYDKTSVIKKAGKFLETASKYGVHINNSADEIASVYLKCLSANSIRSNEFYELQSFNTEHFYTLTRVFENICLAKFSRLFIFSEDALWGIFYVVFTLSAMLLLFRITYWKQFLITLVIIALYPLLMLIITELIYFTGVSRGSFYQASLLLVMLLGLLSFIRTGSEKREFLPFYNILNQLFYVSLPFVAVLLLSFLNDATNIFHRWDHHPFDYYDLYNNPTHGREQIYEDQMSAYLYFYWQKQYELWLGIMKYGGIAVFVLLLPLFRELFVRQISLPRKT